MRGLFTTETLQHDDSYTTTADSCDNCGANIKKKKEPTKFPHVRAGTHYFAATLDVDQPHTEI